jgi:hypothetical protein
VTATDQAHQLAQPLLPNLVAVPGVKYGTCPTCHSSRKPDYQRCYPCQEAHWLLGGDVPAVLPITYSIERSQVHYALRNYKDNFDVAVRIQFRNQLAGLLSLFMTSHQQCLAPFDVVTCLPSRKERTAAAEIVTMLKRFESIYQPVLTVGGGTTHTASADRFEASPSVEGRRVLIIDDTFTTGASVFSATSALRAAGALVENVLVIGRHVNPFKYQLSADLVEAAKDLKWAEHECVLCRTSESLF